MTLDISLRVALHKQQQILPPVAPRFRFAWDDELPDWGYKCRDLTGYNPPAVLRFAPQILPARQEIGDYRVNLTKDPSWRWWDTITIINDGDEHKTEYLTGNSRAQFNTSGWAQMAYLGMSGNEISVLKRENGWVCFDTLRPSDWLKVRSMSHATHPHLIHSFTCVTWKDGRTVHIESTGTPRGVVLYPLVTWDGCGWIPERFVVEL